MSIINLLLSFFNYNYKMLPENDMNDMHDMNVKKIYNSMNNEITLEELVSQTHNIYQKSLIDLSLLSKKINSIETELNKYNNNNLDNNYYNKKHELDLLYKKYKDDEIASNDKKEDYTYAYKNFYKE